MRLIELNPQYTASPPGITFQCPRCRLGVVNVRLRQGEPKDGVHGCNALPPNFDTLTITPSIADDGLCRRCPGWHGLITDGEVA